MEHNENVQLVRATLLQNELKKNVQGRIYGEGTGGAPPQRPPPLRFSNTTGILPKKMWFIGVEVEQEKSAPS